MGTPCSPGVAAGAKSERTEAEVKATRLRQDLGSWFAGRHGSGEFGILARDGREVARFGKEADRDMVLALIKSHNTLEIAANYAWDAAGESRIDGGDQNPHGWRDTLFSAKEDAKRLFSR